MVVEQQIENFHDSLIQICMIEIQKNLLFFIFFLNNLDNGTFLKIYAQKFLCPLGIKLG